MLPIIGIFVYNVIKSSIVADAVLVPSSFSAASSPSASASPNGLLSPLHPLKVPATEALLVAETLKLLKKTGNENLSEKIFNEKELDELIYEESIRGLAKKILEVLQESKAEEIVLIDIRKTSNLADYLFICEGRSQLHCRGITQM